MNGSPRSGGRSGSSGMTGGVDSKGRSRRSNGNWIVWGVPPPPSEPLNALLVERGQSPLATGVRMSELIRRPRIGYADLAPFDRERPELSTAEAEECEIKIKYDGYIKRQQEQVEAMRTLEERPLPENLDYTSIEGLRLEAREKLQKIKPLSVGQAGRISGVTPADITVLLIWLAQHKGETR